jgi:hypothetical protein
MASTLTVNERLTVHAEGFHSGQPITWGTQAAPVSGGASKRDVQFANLYGEPVWVKSLYGDLYVTSTAAGTFNPTSYRMLVDLRPGRGFAWTPGPRPLWLYSDYQEKSRLDFSYLPKGGVVLQPGEGFLLTFANDTGQSPTLVVGVEAYMPRDPAKTSWDDPEALWTPVLQQGVVTVTSKSVGYMPVRAIGTVSYRDSLSNENDRPLLVRAITISNVPTTWGAPYKGFQMTLKIRRRGNTLKSLTAREILGGVSNYVSPGLGLAWVEETRLFTLKKPYLLEPNETLGITYGICTDTYGASGYAAVPAGA